MSENTDQMMDRLRKHNAGHPEPEETGRRAEASDGGKTQLVFVGTGYDSLFMVLCKALHQAQEGKGKERHANGKPFEKQPIMAITDLVGMGFQTGQAIKKTVEAHGMVNRNQFVAAERELLGAINFLAAAVLRIEQMAGQVDLIDPEA